jgi:hypothetical protein
MLVLLTARCLTFFTDETCYDCLIKISRCLCLTPLSLEATIARFRLFEIPTELFLGCIAGTCIMVLKWNLQLGGQCLCELIFIFIFIVEQINYSLDWKFCFGIQSFYSLSKYF